MKPPSLTIGHRGSNIRSSIRRRASCVRTSRKSSKTAQLILREQVKAELHQSMVEVGTEVCRTPAEARAELIRLAPRDHESRRSQRLKIAAAGTHPFSSWVDQEITPFERYLGVKQDMQDLAQQLLIFGTMSTSASRTAIFSSTP